MGFFISAMLSVRGKCALTRADNSADMKKPM